MKRTGATRRRSSIWGEDDEDEEEEEIDLLRDIFVAWRWADQYAMSDDAQSEHGCTYRNLQSSRAATG